jgi:hypothetical protein
VSAVHDHFEGSAHCVECEGPCALTGVERALTEMVRWRLERQPWLTLMEVESLKNVGADPAKLVARAKACNP